MGILSKGVHKSYEVGKTIGKGSFAVVKEGKHKASGELCLEWHELACPKLPLELVYEQPAFVRALMPCHATDSDPKAHPWDLALLETGGADC